MARFDLREYARRGAETRVNELTSELEQIYRTFPELRRGAKKGTRGAAAAGAAVGVSTRRRRKPMTAAQKRAVSLRMKKYWAERRKAQAKVK